MNQIFEIKTNAKRQFILLLVWSLLLFAAGATAQKLPKEIRGYKVYQARISIKNTAEKTEKSAAPDKSEAFVKIGEPELVDVSLTGVTLELSAEIDAVEQSGTIDFLTFHDFRVNGLPVEVEEYRKSFDFKKNQLITLPQPVKIFVGTGDTLRGAIGEMRASKDEWTVTGRIFVFGQFKKSFLKFKRVIPVEINLKIKNPLKKVVSELSVSSQPSASGRLIFDD